MLYKAFISYSHAADGKLAPALQSALHHFAKPWYHLRTFKVFRDKTSLSANPALWPSIKRALSESEFFLLLASPVAAKSIWVRREVEWWLANRSVEKLFVVLTDGDLVWDEVTGDIDWTKTTALPDNLRSRFESEPLYVDLRWAKTADNLSLRHTQFRSAILDLAAPLRDIPKDDLDGEDIRQHRRLMAVRNIAVSTIIGFAVVATWQWHEATQQRDEAQRQKKIAIARQLAAQSELLRTQQPDGLPRSVLLAIESFRRLPSPEAYHALHEGMMLLPYQVTVVKHTDIVRDVAFSQDGQYLATGSDDGTAIIWDVETGKEQVRLPHGIFVYSVAFSPNGKFLATACMDQTARVWDVVTGQEILRLDHKMKRSDSVNAIAFSPDSKYLATGTNDFNAHIWEISTGSEISLMPHDEAVNSVAYSPDGQYLVTGSGNTAGKQRPEIAKGRGTVWHIPTQRQVIQVDLDNAVQGVAFAPDGKSFATGSWDNTARIWEISTGREIMRIIHPAGLVDTVAFSPDSRYLATGSTDQTARVWSLETRQEVTRITHDSAVNSVVFSPDSRYLATASFDQSARIWESGNKHEISRLPAAEFNLDAANGSTVAILLNNLKSEINNLGWESISGRRVADIPSAYADATLVTSHDGKYLARFTLDLKTPVITKVPDMEESVRLPHPAPVNKLAFSSVGELVATASSDGMARIWELSTGQEILRIPHNADVICVSFSADKLLATGSVDGIARVWETTTGQEIMNMPHEEKVSAIAFSPDGQYIAASNGRLETWIWNISSNKPYVIAQFSHEKNLRTVNFSPAGQYLLTINGDPLSFDNSAAHLWLWNPKDLVDEACARLTRNLTPKEWKRYLTDEKPRKTCTNLGES